MKIYHGTSGRIVDRVLSAGIKPRKNNKSNWEVQSHNDMVYLTSVYAGYFAASACGKRDDKWLLLEVDTNLLDTQLLFPDEDFLEQITRNPQVALQLGVKLPKGLRARTKYFRDNLDLFQDLWKMSLNHLGNCCYRGVVSPEAITRAVVFDPKLNYFIASTSIDPIICVDNFRHVGVKYEALTRWFFEEDVDPLKISFHWFQSKEMMPDFMQEHYESTARELKKRDGLVRVK